jgi:hypothetical protein
MFPQYINNKINEEIKIKDIQKGKAEVKSSICQLQDVMDRKSLMTLTNFY